MIYRIGSNYLPITEALRTVVFQNTVQINDSGAAFVIVNGNVEFSGDADLGIAGTPYWAKLMMCMTPVSGGVVTCRLADRASLKLAYLDTSANYIGSGRVCQDGTGTTVSVSKVLNIGDPLVVQHGGTVNSPRNYYTLNNGSLNVGTLNCGLKMPGTFLMTNGTLTVANIVVGSLVETCEFRMTGGDLYPGSGGISLLNSASFLLGGGTVHMTNAAWASDAALTLTGENGDTAFETAENTATLSGTLSGSGGLVKTGAGTLNLNGSCAFKGKLEVAEGTVMFGAYSSIDNVSEIVATNGTIAFADAAAVKQNPFCYLGTLRVASGNLTLNRNITVYVGTYIVDDVAQSVGSYAMDGGWVKVVNFWTGGGANANWTNADNWNGVDYPSGLGSIAYFTNAASVTLDADMIVGQTILNGGGSTVTIAGTGRTYTVGNNDSQYMHILSRNVNDRLVFQTDVRHYSNSAPYDRIYFNSTFTYQGTAVFQGALKIHDSGAAFLIGSGGVEFSGDGNLRTTSGSYNWAKVFMSQGAAAGTVVTCRLTDRASLQLATLDLNTVPAAPGRVYQDGTGTSVSVSQRLVVGDPVLAHAGTSASPMNIYTLNNGSLTVGTLYCGFKAPGTFLMTNGTLTASTIIAGTLVSTCEFRMTGGDLYMGAGGMVVSNSASVYLGGGTVHATAAWASDAALTLTGEGGDTAFDTAGHAVTVGALDGAGGLVKTGAGTLTLGGANVFTGGVTVTDGTLAASNALVNATNLSVAASGAMLSLGSADSLNTNATLNVAAGGLVNLDFSGTATVDALVVNGVAKSPGTYDSEKSYITGTGSLVVLTGPPQSGTILGIR